MEKLRALAKDLKGELPFVVLIAIIYFGGVLIYQSAAAMTPELLSVRSIGVEMIGFTLTLLVARWWFSRAFLSAPSNASVAHLTQEIESLRAELDALRDDLQPRGNRVSIVPTDALHDARLRLSEENVARNQAIVNLSGELLRLVLAQAGTGLLTRVLSPGTDRNKRF